MCLDTMFVSKLFIGMRTNYSKTVKTRVFLYAFLSPSTTSTPYYALVRVFQSPACIEIRRNCSCTAAVKNVWIPKRVRRRRRWRPSSLISALKAVKEPKEAANCHRKQGPGTKVCHDNDSRYALKFRVCKIVQMFWMPAVSVNQAQLA